MKLHRLLKALPLVVLPKEDPEILQLEQDNRKVQSGTLFFCITGATVDGHTFASDAVAKGAVAVIAERVIDVDVPVIIVKDATKAMAILANAFFDQPTQRMQLIGITGTNGKTTISHLIEHLLKDANQTTGLIGTMYMKIGNQEIFTKNTTPDSLTLQKVFKQMNDVQVDTAVMEVSSHALIQGRVHGCDYDIAVFSNLTQDHLDYHETMEEYLRAKSLLFAQLGNTYHADKPKYAVLNADDAASRVIEKETAAPVITYGIDQKADFMAEDILLSGNGTTFTLVTPTGNYTVRIQLVGKFSVYNVLAALTAGYLSGLGLSQMIASIEKVQGVAGRFELVKGHHPFLAIVDYAHTPDSLENVLKTVQEFAKKRIFVVVGCGGDRDKTKRPIMAKIACDFSTDPIFTSDNPRSEDPEMILTDMEQGVIGQQYIKIVDRKDAIAYAVNQAEDGDVIVIAGKGHETYQQIGNEILDFDDRQVTAEAIKKKYQQ